MNEVKNIFIHEKDLIIVNLKGSDSALICKPFKCSSGIIINFISLREFEKHNKEKELENLFNISFYEIDENTSLVLSSSLSTQNLKTEVFEAVYGGKKNPSWRVIENEETCEN